MLEDIKGFEPAQKHRRMDATTTTTTTNSTTTNDAYDASLLDEHVENATRLKYRLNKGISLDYGEHYTNKYAAEYLKISQEFVDILHKCRTFCNKCNKRITYSIVGAGAARTFTGYCTNENCTFDESFSDQNIKIGFF